MRQLPGTGLRRPSWENVHAFLQVIEHGSFRAAAVRLRIPINRLRLRVAKLEDELGMTLLTRHVDGVRATAEGRQVLGAARNMEAAYFALMRAKEGAPPAAVGEVKLAVPEGLGTFWLAPRLAEFRRTHPGLLVELRSGTSAPQAGEPAIDAAVRLVRPAEPDLKAVKLGRLHLMPYAAASYVEAHGVPASIDDLAEHRLVLRTGSRAPALPASLSGEGKQTAVCIRTNSSGAHAIAVGSGAGIGWLATYASAVTEGLVPIDLDARSTLDLWLAFDRKVERVPRVRHLVDWVVDCFDPRRFPWFRDEFVHPNEFAKIYRGEPLFNVSGHFAEDEIPFEFPELALIAGGRQNAG